MPIITYGINHQSAPIEIRERMTFDPFHIREALTDLIKHPAVNEALLLSTCNRTELYTVVDHEEIVKEWWFKKYDSATMNIAPFFYCYEEKAAIRHALRVATGLDSMVLGEPQILGQMKQAYRLACEIGTVGKQLHHLFPAIFSASKQIRYKTDISKNPISLAYGCVLLAKRIFSDLKKHRILLIGSGEIMELIATHFHHYGIGEMIFANRTLEKAAHLSEDFQGKAIRIGDIPAYLSHIDIIVTATASQLPIIGKGMIESVLKYKKRRPLLMLDLAMPRDIEPEIGQLEDIYLYNLDHLHQILQQNLKNREQAAKQAEIMTDLQAAHYIRQLRILNVADLIRRYRSRLETLRDQELTKAIDQLQKGKDPKMLLEWMAHNLVNKIMHQPTIQLREAAYHEQREVLLLIKNFFNL